MRRWLAAAVVVPVVAILGFMAPAAEAQTPKVTINGLVDMISSWQRNMSIEDSNYDRTDSQWYSRTRVRPDITAEVGTTKFVFGLEYDFQWGQGGAADTGTPVHFGASAGADLNTDLRGIGEVKWAYTEFDVPWVPGARLRLGAQPFAVTYKLAALAQGDFAGAHFQWSITPAIRAHFTYAQIEENSSEFKGLFSGGLLSGAQSEDSAIIASVEITPFKGLDVRPLYSYARFDGTTSGSSRAGRGGVPNAAPVNLLCNGSASCGGFVGNIPIPGYAANDIENRHTIGVDARLKVGPFYVDPTIFYQFGSREVTVPNCSTAPGGCALPPFIAPLFGRHLNQDIDAWFIDIRGGFQAGPLLVEGAFIYTTGNPSEDNLMYTNADVHYYQPISTDSSYYAGWANIFALGVDYFNMLYQRAPGLSTGQHIGYDKYGLVRLGLRGSYALTPTFTAYANLTASWTAEDVDVNSLMNTGAGIIPVSSFGGTPKHENYLGTEIDAGLTWRLAPNLVFDLVGGYLFAGDALGYFQQFGTAAATTANCGTTTGTCPTVNAQNQSTDVSDVKTIAARFRFTF
jgi:hypothetical protein